MVKVNDKAIFQIKLLVLPKRYIFIKAKNGAKFLHFVDSQAATGSVIINPTCCAIELDD